MEIQEEFSPRNIDGHKISDCYQNVYCQPTFFYTDELKCGYIDTSIFLMENKRSVFFVHPLKFISLIQNILTIVNKERIDTG